MEEVRGQERTGDDILILVIRGMWERKGEELEKERARKRKGKWERKIRWVKGN